MRRLFFYSPLNPVTVYYVLIVIGCECLHVCNRGSDATQTEGLLLIQPIRLWCHLSAICHRLPVCPAPILVAQRERDIRNTVQSSHVFIHQHSIFCCSSNEKQCDFYFHKQNNTCSFSRLKIRSDNVLTVLGKMRLGSFSLRVEG